MHAMVLQTLQIYDGETGDHRQRKGEAEVICSLLTNLGISSALAVLI